MDKSIYSKNSFFLSKRVLKQMRFVSGKKEIISRVVKVDSLTTQLLAKNS